VVACGAWSPARHRGDPQQLAPLARQSQYDTSDAIRVHAGTDLSFEVMSLHADGSVLRML